MGSVFQYQIDHQHPKADPECEGCRGSGWLLALVDNPSWLECAGVKTPSDFVMACSECHCITDVQAINQAKKCGLIIGRFGVVKKIPAKVKKTIVLEEKPKSYWEGTGNFQVEYNRLYKSLVPQVGKSDTVHGEVLRCATRVYYDIFNNGGCNLKMPPWGDNFREVLLRYRQMLMVVAKKLDVDNFRGKLSKFLSGKADVKTCDEIMDVVTSWTKEVDAESLPGLTKGHALVKAAQQLVNAVSFAGIELDVENLQLEIDKIPSANEDDTE